MIKTLKYNLEFSSTGRKFSQNISFKPGLTIINGRNEQGKSLILEMIEYAWFGSSALRGKADDYKVIEVDMVWETKGQTYTVSRHGSVQNLNKTKAVGANAVNKEILRILGVDLDVFRITASAKQGELDKLTARMRPTERRKMVDEVIGLNSLETVEKLCRAEATALRRLRDDLSNRLIEPEAPAEPEDYTNSLVLEKIYRDQIKIEAERNQLLKIMKPVMPTEPTKGDFDDAVEDYELLRKRQQAERDGIERALRAIPTASFTRQDTEYAEEFFRQQMLGPVPMYGRHELQRWLEDHEELKRLNHSVECPTCHTRFIPNEGTITTPVSEPPLSVAEINKQMKACDAWEDFEGIVLTEYPRMTFEELQKEQIATAQAEVRNQLQTQLDAIEEMPSRDAELKRKLQWDKDKVAYDSQLELYVERLTTWSNAQERLKELHDPDPGVEPRLKKSQMFEEQKRAYDADMLRFTEAKAEVESLNTQIESYTNGAEALKYVRSQVKQHLVPSLNRVASHLLSEMTNGQRRSIVVDEEFEVSVDGQPVRTLSGSGISVVNLALRIALGQVLTQKVIPIFLADEIDHDMDADRAAATHAAIRSLTKTLDQIIIVSHKQVDGDNIIGV